MFSRHLAAICYRKNIWSPREVNTPSDSPIIKSVSVLFQKINTWEPPVCLKFKNTQNKSNTKLQLKQKTILLLWFWSSIILHTTNKAGLQLQTTQDKKECLFIYLVFKVHEKKAEMLPVWLDGQPALFYWFFMETKVKVSFTGNVLQGCTIV